MRILLRTVAVLVAGVAMAGCATTSRIDDASLATGSTTRTTKGIALVKIGAAVNSCTTASVNLGTRDGTRFKDVTTLSVAGLNSPTQPAVAEVELAPGEYHVTGYTCVTPRGEVMRIVPKPQLSGRAESFASFSIAAGEVVNAGFLMLAPVRAIPIGAGPVVDWQILVRDWPIDEVNRFKAQRPQLYATMQARLMTVTKVPPVTAAQVASACEPHKKLQAEGKIQELPPLCRPGAVIPGAAAPASPSAPARGNTQPAGAKPKPRGVDA